MTHLTAQLESLLRFYAAAQDQDQGEGDPARLREQFRKDVEPLVAQYGHRAVIAALDELSGAASPSVPLH
jgi:hypothetical protein